MRHPIGKLIGQEGERLIFGRILAIIAENLASDHHSAVFEERFACAVIRQ